ncbi:acyl-CoA thioesterase [Candidatus Acetothermia bacterium]|jgi:acyl-CoA thioester hydrolase|nr:acyl-CoA thioesterase [Candidatus Acetothermia bacterium]MCI2431352.1 acyl-CoA thioesterase [Candidatus Acetothermia bacterium]MCI2437006.1 acyl-CoA thioesterase [Candidatus Acetothermia bacterium]
MRPKSTSRDLFPAGSFCTEVRTRFAEIDLQGVVHHSYYLIYCEVARVEYFKALGFDFRQARRNGDFDIVVAEAHCKYIAPARFDEMLTIYTWVSRVRHTSFTLDYYICRNEDDLWLAQAQTTLVAIDPQMKKARSLPEEMRRALKKASDSAKNPL